MVAQFLAVRSNLLQLDTHAEDTSTLLHVAAESGTAKVIELLLTNGASHSSGGKAVLGEALLAARLWPECLHLFLSRTEESRSPSV